MTLFVLTETKHNPETSLFLITIKGYSHNSSLLQDKVSAHKENQNKLKKIICDYNQKSSQYEQENPNLLISEFSTQNPLLGPEELVHAYLNMQVTYLENKHKAIGVEPDKSLLFTTLDVSQANEILS